MDNLLRQIKTHGELLQFAKVNGYGEDGTKELIETWNNLNNEPELEVEVVDYDEE